LKTYLSGGMENTKEINDFWREEISIWLDNKLNHKVFNPVEIQKKTLSEFEIKNFRGWIKTDSKKFKQIIHKIIDRDLSVIKNEVDYVICYWDGSVLHGGGTHGELTMAYYFSKPVYMILDVPLNKTSAWILGCTSMIFNSFEELKVFLLNHYEKK